MISLDKIRNDLKDIRYYYSRRNFFKDELPKIGGNKILEIAEQYNKAICLAPPRLYDLYACLYIENGTQESVAEYLGYSPEYIRMLNKKLLKYFQEYLDKFGNTIA